MTNPHSGQAGNKASRRFGAGEGGEEMREAGKRQKTHGQTPKEYSAKELWDLDLGIWALAVSRANAESEHLSAETHRVGTCARPGEKLHRTNEA